MKDFKRGGNKFGASRGDRNDRDSRDSRSSMTMHQATCADCGKKCEVPFRPSGDRPVYCSDCFGNQQGGANSGRSDRPERRNFDRPSYGDRPNFADRPKFKATCAKCGDECDVPFKPTSGKPVYCSACFDKSGTDRGDRTNRSDNRNRSSFPASDQLEQINAKLDRLLKILAPVAEAMTSEIAPAEKKPAKEKKVVASEDASVANKFLTPKKEKRVVARAKARAKAEKEVIKAELAEKKPAKKAVKKKK